MDLMELYIATTNRHKVEEIGGVLGEYGIKLRHRHLRVMEPDFDSLEEIAEEKARQAFRQVKRPVIAEDTGVFFEGYNNFPGSLAKRVFLGIGFDGLLALIRRSRNRRARFKTVICYSDGKKSKCFSGVLNGKLLVTVVSPEKDRLPYEKIFVPDGYRVALADIERHEKNRISHRAKAARQLGKWLARRK